MSDGETSEEVRSYATEVIEALSEQRSGTLLYDLGEAMADVIATVRQTGKPGSLTLKLSVRPAQKGGGAYLNISDEIKVTKPKPETAETLMYAHEDGRLSRRDPRQPALPAFDGKES